MYPPIGDNIEIPDAIEPIRAWKVLALDKGGWLHSPMILSELTVTTGLNQAECESDRFQERGLENHKEPPPVKDCSCGWYATKDSKRYRFDYDIIDMGSLHSRFEVLTIVALSGKVVLAERGYRGQYLEVKEVFVPLAFPVWDHLEHVKRNYADTEFRFMALRDRGGTATFQLEKEIWKAHYEMESEYE